MVNDMLRDGAGYEVFDVVPAVRGHDDEVYAQLFSCSHDFLGRLSSV